MTDDQTRFLRITARLEASLRSTDNEVKNLASDIRWLIGKLSEAEDSVRHLRQEMSATEKSLEIACLGGHHGWDD